jgi:hypothetical protein
MNINTSFVLMIMLVPAAIVLGIVLLYILDALLELFGL